MLPEGYKHLEYSLDSEDYVGFLKKSILGLVAKVDTIPLLHGSW